MEVGQVSGVVLGVSSWLGLLLVDMVLFLELDV